jgi:hypothetical protein
MQWHAKRKEARLKDAKKLDANVVLSHHTDASQWKALDAEYPTFGEDPRNISWVRAHTDSILLGAKAAHIAPGPCLYGYTTSPVVVHEEEVHAHEHANSMAKITRNRHQSLSQAIER